MNRLKTKLLIASSTLSAALLISGLAQADVSDFAGGGSQTTDRTSADEMDSSTNQYYADSTDASQSYSGSVSGSTSSSATLSRRAAPISDFSGYRSLGSASVVGAASNSGSSAFDQNNSTQLGYGNNQSGNQGINQGGFTPNAGLPSSSISGSASIGMGSAGGTSTSTISAP